LPYLAAQTPALSSPMLKTKKQKKIIARLKPLRKPNIFTLKQRMKQQTHFPSVREIILSLSSITTKNKKTLLN
jgi:hypothetical protein